MKHAQSKLCLALSSILPMTVVSPLVSADVLNFDWQGHFVMLDPYGSAVSNSSISPKGNNTFLTPISGSLMLDTDTGMGSATLLPFNWLNNSPSVPFEVTAFDLHTIGDGSGGPGTLMLGNMLFNWNGTNGIPVSIVLDAAGFLSSMGTFISGGAGTTVSGVGATPASDGTYVGSSVPGTGTGPGGYPGYLNQGPTPIATTAWNTTSLCTRPGTVSDGACMGLLPSGGLPLIFDGAANPNDYSPNTGGGIGGSPSIDGPFPGYSFNFDFTSLTYNVCYDCPPPPVPIPAAVWLFGSGLIGLIGVARRRSQTPQVNASLL